MAAGHQKVAYLKTKQLSLDSQDGDYKASEKEEEETKKILYEYVFLRAETDMNLSREETQSFEEAKHDIQEETVSDLPQDCTKVARRLADLGDEIDAKYSEELEDIVQLYEDPEEAFTSFSTVLQNVFEWNDNGLPKISFGRIAAVLGYCYHLCKSYLHSRVSSSGLVTLLGMLATFLVKFFLKAKFYDWLNQQGGWVYLSLILCHVVMIQELKKYHIPFLYNFNFLCVKSQGQLLQMTSTSLLDKLGANRNIFLLIGVASLTIYALQYFRGR